jgi:hypothetical protein
VTALEGAEFEDVGGGEAVGHAHFHEAVVGPGDAGIVEEGSDAGFEVGAVGRRRGGPFAGEEVEGVLIGGDGTEEVFKVGGGGGRRGGHGLGSEEAHGTHGRHGRKGWSSRLGRNRTVTGAATLAESGRAGYGSS